MTGHDHGCRQVALSGSKSENGTHLSVLAGTEVAEDEGTHQEQENGDEATGADDVEDCSEVHDDPGDKQDGDRHRRGLRHCGLEPVRSLLVTPLHEEPDPQWEQHEEDQRGCDVPRVDLDPADQQWNHDRHVNHGHHHEQDHQTDREGNISFGCLSKFGQERGAGSSCHEDEADVETVVEREESVDADGDERDRYEVEDEGNDDQTGVAERFDDL